MFSKQSFTQGRFSILTLIFPVLILLAMQSCKTYQVFNIDVLEPADIFVPPSVNKVIIAPNGFPERSDKKHTVYEIYDNLYYDTVYYDTVIARTGVDQLAGLLNYNQRFSAAVINAPEMPLPGHPNDFNNGHISKIRSLCEEHDADAFILLSDMDKYVEYDVYSSYLGTAVSFYSVYLNTRWMFINPFESKLIDSRLIRDTLFYEVDGVFGTTSPLLYMTGRELLLAAAEEAAMDYGLTITPHYVQSPRIIFKAGNKEIRRGYKKAVEGGWREAATFWRNTLTDPDPVNRARACFNLALASEMEGLLQPALQWAEKSYAHFPDELSQTYISILQERIRQQDDLILQIEGNSGL
jgi:hypothetical protein